MDKSFLLRAFLVFFRTSNGNLSGTLVPKDAAPIAEAAPH